LFSAVVFAGASQFIALNLLMTGMGPAGIILTTLLVNFRHFLMSAYLSTRLRNLARKTYFLLAFGVTDEVFSVLSFHDGPLTPRFVFFLELSAWSGWVSGTVCGFVLGGFLPEILSQSMGVALYALLLAILLPALKASRQTVFLAVMSAGLNTLLIRLDLLPAGWTIIVCILVVALAGAFLTPEKKEMVRD
jgi:4-azaleucine resistance transporter AzlC